MVAAPAPVPSALGGFAGRLRRGVGQNGTAPPCAHHLARLESLAPARLLIIVGMTVWPAAERSTRSPGAGA